MNSEDKNGHMDGYRSLLVLDEISRNGDLTQREISKNLGIALGLINSYIKNLISKGYITVSGIPAKRYKYYLTPNGFLEKTRLTYEHLRNFTNLYRVARTDFAELFARLKELGISRVAFCGVDEVAEIAYLSLKEAGLELVCISDIERTEKFFDMPVVGIEKLRDGAAEAIVITSFYRSAELSKALIEAGVVQARIIDISKKGQV